MKINMKYDICKNSVGATMRYIPPTLEYEEHLMKFSCFDKLRKKALYVTPKKHEE